MSCKFSCFLSFADAQKENDIGVFHSDSGDVYKVKYKSNVCRDLLLRIEWTIPKQILFTVKLYSTTFKRCLSSKGMLVDGKRAFMKLRGAFNVSNSRDYKVLCVVNLIPYIKFNDNKEQPPDLFNDSGFTESELQQSSLDENNAVANEEISSKNEMDDDNRDVENKSTVKVKELNLPNVYENSQSVNEMVNASNRNDCSNFGKNATTDEMIVEESIAAYPEYVASDMPVLLMNQDSLNLGDQADKILKDDNVSVSLEDNSENKKNHLENYFTEIMRDTIKVNSDKQDHENNLSDDKSDENYTVIRRNKKNPIFITKRLTLDDYSEEIIENIKTINIHNVDESTDKSSENSFMDVDLRYPSNKIPTASFNEDNSFGKVDKNIREEFSRSISRDINHKKGTEFHVSSENAMECSVDGIKLDINSDRAETSSLLESKNVSINKNDSDNKQLECLSKSRIHTGIKNPDPSKINMSNTLTSNKESSSSTMCNYSKLKIPRKNISFIKSCNLESRKFSSKSSLVFQSLVRTLSVADYDTRSKDVVEKNKERSSKEKLQNSLESDSDDSKIFPIMESEIKGLSLDMLDLLVSGDMVDAQITNGEKHVNVHRAIVSARSSSLKKLFVRQKNINAVDVNFVAVVDIPSDILEDVVIFLYVGLIHIESAKMLQDLYQVAERYCINDLIDICSKYI